MKKNQEHSTESSIETALKTVESNVSAMDSLVESHSEAMRGIFAKAAEYDPDSEDQTDSSNQKKLCFEIAKKYNEVLETNKKQVTQLKEEIDRLLAQSKESAKAKK